MNKRIRELYKQAYCMAFDEADDKNFLDHHMEMFAELIVRECAELVKDQLKVIPADQKDWDGHNYGYTAAVYESLDRFKEHFGVEE